MTSYRGCLSQSDYGTAPAFFGAAPGVVDMQQALLPAGAEGLVYQQCVEID